VIGIKAEENLIGVQSQQYLGPKEISGDIIKNVNLVKQLHDSLSRKREIVGSRKLKHCSTFILQYLTTEIEESMDL
jgi:hypothetical protein